MKDKEFPFLIISSFSEDVEFGSIYKFLALDANDLKTIVENE